MALDKHSYSKNDYYQNTIFGKIPLSKSLIKLQAIYKDKRFFTYFNPDITPEKTAKDRLVSQMKALHE